MLGNAKKPQEKNSVESFAGEGFGPYGDLFFFFSGCVSVYTKIERVHSLYGRVKRLLGNAKSHRRKVRGEFCG